MIGYLLRRLALMIPTLFGITLVVFLVMAAAPGGISADSLVAGQNLEPNAKRALEAYYNRRYGLDQPAPLQYLRWLNSISPIGFEQDDAHRMTGFSFDKGSDLGNSFRYGRPVADLLAERLPITLALNALSLPLIFGIAITLGIRAATHRGGLFDTASGTALLALWSVPPMLAGILLIGFFASDQHWHWFPTAGLSQREALDMTFLPWWDSASSALRAAAFGVGGAALAGVVARLPSGVLRVLVFGAAGAWLGLETGLAHARPSALLGVLVAVPGAGLGVLLAVTTPTALRVTIAVTLGLVLGLGLDHATGVGSFTRGFALDRLWHLVLPVLCLAYGGLAFLAKLMRTAMLENLDSDFARTARAKGAPESVVLWRHVFRASLLPLITVAAGLLPSLLAGSVIVESIFSIDGMGKLAVEAVKTRDRELVLSLTLISGFLTLIGYLLADIAYAMADPRVNYE